MAHHATVSAPVLPLVDVNALKTNQASIVALVALAFVLGVEAGGAWLIAFVALSLAVGAIRPGYGPFQLFYRRVVRATGVVAARPRPEDAAPHRFAQSMGATVLTASAVALFAGATGLGWVMAWLVLALALINLLFGFCLGCFFFLQLRRVRKGAIS